MSPLRLSRIFPRIDHCHSTTLEILDVAGDDRKAVNPRRRRDQTIHFRQFPLRTQTPPDLSLINTDPKNPPLVARRNFQKPFLKCGGFPIILCADLFNAFSDLTQGQHTEVIQFRRMGLKPCTHRRVCPVTFPDFGNHVGIDQEHAENAQSSNSPWSLRPGQALRGSFRSKCQSYSSSAAPDSASAVSARFIPSLVFPTVSAMAFAKIRRCSSSVDTPCAAARSFRDLTTSSGIFLTNN